MFFFQKGVNLVNLNQMLGNTLSIFLGKKPKCIPAHSQMKS